MSAAPLLEVSDLSVRFDTEDGSVYAVDRLSFEVGQGEVLGIVGESGCGKSVACLSLARLLPENATVTGRAVLNGVDLLTLSPRALRRVRGRELAYVFQEPMVSLNPSFRVGRQIGETLEHHLGLSRSAARERTIELLRTVRIQGAADRIDDYPYQLSGGMQQRVLIAMALACNPKVLIADEPTTALDVTTQAAILDVMRDIRERLGTAIVLVTHNLGVAAGLADRILVMYAGRRVEEAPAERLFDDPQHPYTIGLLGALPRPGDGDSDRLREIPGSVASLRSLPGGCSFSDRCERVDRRRCSAAPPTLREVTPDHRVACFYPGPA
jgi:peptide/nickel transport system ATP-binding protein